METQQVETGQWAILELMGRKVVAGYLTKDDWQGHAMLRIDVPATSAFPAFTQVYGPQAVYCITYTSEEVARLTSEHNRVNPISVYVPDLQDVRRVHEENAKLRDTLREMQERLRKVQALPSPSDDGKLCICCHKNAITWPRVCDECQDHEAQTELARRYIQDGDNPDDYRCMSCGMIYDGGMRCSYCGSKDPMGMGDDEDYEPEL